MHLFFTALLRSVQTHVQLNTVEMCSYNSLPPNPRYYLSKDTSHKYETMSFKADVTKRVFRHNPVQFTYSLATPGYATTVTVVLTQTVKGGDAHHLLRQLLKSVSEGGTS